MTKELATVNASVPATFNQEDWGQSEMSTQDIVIPKINLMQPTSQPVTDGLAKFGDFVSSLDNAVIGDASGFEFIPFYMKKFHWVSKLKDPKSSEFKFDRTEAITCAADEQKPWDDADEDGMPIKRTLVRQFYGMVKGQSVPMIINAKGMSGNFAKKLITQMYVMNKASRLAPCGKAVMIKALKQKNAKGNFATFDFSVSRSTTTEEIVECLNWYKIVSSGGAVEQKEESQRDMGF